MQIGARIGAYEVIAKLGEGGMGEVYRARDTKLDRDVAIKVLPDALVADADRVGRFQREAKTLASLNHPNIAAIHGLEESGPSTGSARAAVALVMELVDGPTLAECIVHGPMTLDNALPIARQIALAIEAAHEQGIVHRDLKPANVKVRPDGTVKVLDFGLAKAMDDRSASVSGERPGLSMSPTRLRDGYGEAGASPTMTKEGMILGTAAYMAPEQARGKPVDKRADIWAFGCVLYEMLTGARAFSSDEVSDTLAFIITKDVDWSALPRSTPSAIRRVLRRCLEKDPAKRLRDIADARIEIDEAIAGPAAGALAPTVTEIPVPTRQSSARGVMWTVAIALLSAALAAGAATWALLRTPAATPPAVTRFSIALGESLQFPNISRGRSMLALSPDGRQIVFVANQQLYVRDMASPALRSLSGGQGMGVGVTAPTYSPDGQSIAYFSLSDRAIKRIPLIGGSPTTICEAENPFGLTWDVSGILYGQSAKGIFRVPAAGGQPEQLVRLNADENADTPQMLPGGRAILFSLAKGAGLARWDQAQVAVQALATGERKVVLENGSAARYLSSGHLIYARAGVLFAVMFDPNRLRTIGPAVSVVEGVRRSIAGSQVQGNPLLSGVAQYSVSENGSLVYLPGPLAPLAQSSDLAWVDRAGKLERLMLPAGGYGHVRISPDGRRAVLAAEEGKEANVYVYPFTAGATLRRLTFGGSSRFPIWTNDGKRVVFQSDREGDAGIFWQPVDGGVAERLTKAEAGTAHVPESWSPTADVLLYSVVQNGTSTLWVLTLSDKQSRKFDGVTSTSPIDASFSPDGHWVAYGSSPTVYVQPYPPDGSLYQVPRANGPHHPFWSRDGKELFYEPTIGQLDALPVTTRPQFSFGTPVAVAAGAYGSTNPAFTRNRDVDVEGRRFIAPVSSDTTVGGTSGAAEILVVLNWTEELKQRVPTR